MKSALLLLTSVFFYTAASAQIVQTDTLKRNYVYKRSRSNFSLQSEYLYSVGAKILSIEQMPKVLNDTGSGRNVDSKLNVFTFKFNDNQLSYRLIGNFYNEPVKFENECKDCESASGKLSDLQIKVGFEKNLSSSIIQPYFGADLGYRNNIFKGEVTNTASPSSPAYEANTEKNSILLGPVFGFKINAISHFTIAIESGIDLMYSYERQEKAYRDAQRTRTFNKYNKFEFLTRPMSFLSLQYNFKANH